MDHDYIVSWPISNINIKTIHESPDKLSKQSRLMAKIFNQLNNQYTPKDTGDYKLDNLLDYIKDQEKDNDDIEEKDNITYDSIFTGEVNFSSIYTANILLSCIDLLSYIKDIKTLSKTLQSNYFNDDNVLINITQMIWIIIKSIGLRFKCIYDFIEFLLKKISTELEGYVPSNYIVIDCNPINPTTEEKKSICCYNRSKQLYTCGRAIGYVNKPDIYPKIFIYNTHSIYDDSMDTLYINKYINKYLQKYLKYKEKYRKLKQKIN